MSAEVIHLSNATPFDLIAEDADGLLTEARNWADGQPVASQAQADDVSRLIEALRLNAKAADDARKEENRPHDEAKAAVQAKYAPLWADPKTKAPGKVFKAIDQSQSGFYADGLWNYSYQPRQGTLKYDGRDLPAAQPGDYILTPWGWMQWHEKGNWLPVVEKPAKGKQLPDPATDPSIVSRPPPASGR